MTIAFKDVYSNKFRGLKGFEVERAPHGIRRIYFLGEEVARYQEGICHAAIAILNTGVGAKRILDYNRIEIPGNSLELFPTEGGRAVAFWGMTVRPPYPGTEPPARPGRKALSWDWCDYNQQRGQYTRFHYLTSTVQIDRDPFDTSTWHYAG